MFQGPGAAPAAGSLAPVLHPNLVFQGPGAAPAASTLATPLHPSHHGRGSHLRARRRSVHHKVR